MKRIRAERDISVDLPAGARLVEAAGRVSGKTRTS
jgi:hypothetical protein